MSEQSALETLRAYPEDTVVADIYDHDEEFAGALNDLFSGSFEYPDFSWRKLKDVLRVAERSRAASPVEQAPFQEINDRYADTIIMDNAASYDAFEIHGVRDLNPPNYPGGTACEVDEDNPQFFSVYAHARGDGLLGGGLDCVGDFSEHAKATAYAEELSKKCNYPVFDYSTQGKQLRDAITKSSLAAEAVAHEKQAFSHVEPAKEQTYAGKVMAVCDHHLVLSLGRNAAIFERSMFKSKEAIQLGSEITVAVTGGKAVLVPQQEKTVGIGR